MRETRTFRRGMLFAVVGAFTAASVLLSPLAASAAPGDAGAVGVDTDVVLTPFDPQAPPGVPVDALMQLAAVAAPPDASQSLATGALNVDLGPSLGGPQDVVLFERIETAASSDNAGASATASVGRMEMNTTSGPMVIENVSVSATCTLGSAATWHDAGTTTVSINGSPVALDPSGVTVIDLSDPGLGFVFVLTLTQSGSSSAGQATATGLEVRIEEDLPGIIVADGKITLARASCESPLAQAEPDEETLSDTGGTLPALALFIGVALVVAGGAIAALSWRRARRRRAETTV